MATTTERQLLQTGSQFGVVWGTEAVLSAWSGVGVVTKQITSHTTTKAARHTVEFDDPATGDLGLLLIAGKTREESIEVTPSNTAKSTAITSNIVPEIGDLVSILDLKSGDLTSAAKYVVMAASGNMASGKIATISMTLKRWNNADLVVLAS